MTSKKEVKWETLGSGNIVLDYGEFYISYRADTSKVSPEFSVLNSLGGLFGLQTGKEETALCAQNSEPKWRILNGDFRKEYEKVARKGLAACITVYEKNKNTARSDWSTDE